MRRLFHGKKFLILKKTPLPQNLKTSDLLKGECTIPQTIKELYSNVLRDCRFQSKQSSEYGRRSSSLAEDIIFYVLCGKIKNSKLITLAMTLKSITSSRKVVEIINKYGHCCS